MVANFYPRPPRGGRLVAITRWVAMGGISIHALREEGDAVTSTCPLVLHISIHALREEGDLLPLKALRPCGNFYPRPPRGGRRLFNCICISVPKFLSTPSARRATVILPPLALEGQQFLSTPSARRATACPCEREPAQQISIHALREEGDSKNRDKISIFKQIIQHSARI